MGVAVIAGGAPARRYPRAPACGWPAAARSRCPALPSAAGPCRLGGMARASAMSTSQSSSALLSLNSARPPSPCWKKRSIWRHAADRVVESRPGSGRSAPAKAARKPASSRSMANCTEGLRSQCPPSRQELALEFAFEQAAAALHQALPRGIARPAWISPPMATSRSAAAEARRQHARKMAGLLRDAQPAAAAEQRVAAHRRGNRSGRATPSAAARSCRAARPGHPNRGIIVDPASRPARARRGGRSRRWPPADRAAIRSRAPPRARIGWRPPASQSGAGSRMVWPPRAKMPWPMAAAPRRVAGPAVAAAGTGAGPPPTRPGSSSR